MLSREDLEKAREEKIPVMALRPRHDNKDLMDDIVVRAPAMFRAEQMDENFWWMACFFDNNEQVAFHVTATDDGRIEVSVTDEPKQWLDLDSGDR